jgi:signal peptidase I
MGMDRESLQNQNPNSNKIESKENFFKEIIKFTIIALIIVVPIRTYIAQPFIVSGASMDPTFTTGEYLIVDQLSYHLESPRRFDVIVFKYPNNPKTYFIKRIIGLPGETISAKLGKITIINKENPDGFEIDDKYVSSNHESTESFQITLGDDEYFVMGDNRIASSDSRAWGPLEAKFIVGKPFVRLFPISKLDIYPGKI